MKEDGFWYWFTNVFESEHFKKGRAERLHWRSFVKDDARTSSKNDVVLFHIADIPNFPQEADIKSIDETAVIEKAYRTVAKVERKYIDAHVEAIRKAGYLLAAEDENTVGIDVRGTETPGTTGIAHIDEWLSKVKDIHARQEGGSHKVSLHFPEGKIVSEETTEGSVGVAIQRVEKFVVCAVSTEISAITLKVALKDYDFQRVSRLTDLFAETKSADRDKIYQGLFSELSAAYALPAHLSAIKNRYEAALASFIGACMKRLAPVREQLAKLLSSYESVTNELNSPEALEQDFYNKKNKSKRIWLLGILLAVIAVADLGLNYVTFNAVLRDKEELILWMTVGFYGILLVGLAEAYVFWCEDYKGIWSLRAMVILVPFAVLLMSSGYLRYLYEIVKGAEATSAPVSLKELSGTQNQQDLLKPLMISVFFTVFSALLFIWAVLEGYRYKYGSLRKFFGEARVAKLDTQIRQRKKRVDNIVAIDLNARVNNLIQSAHREYDEYINGFEHPPHGEQINEMERKLLVGYLFWLKNNHKGMLRIEPGSQINKDNFSALTNIVPNKMLQYLRVKNKAIGFRTGFCDALKGIKNSPDRMRDVPSFHLEDPSTGVSLKETDVAECHAAHQYGYEHGEKVAQEHEAESREPSGTLGGPPKDSPERSNLRLPV